MSINKKRGEVALRVASEGPALLVACKAEETAWRSRTLGHHQEIISSIIGVARQKLSHVAFSIKYCASAAETAGEVEASMSASSKSEASSGGMKSAAAAKAPALDR